MPDVDETIRREGFVTVSDPASGAAGMIVAYAEYLLEAGYNPSEHMFGSCIDIDPVAADMAFIQLSLLGIPAEVVTGNTLTMQQTGCGIRLCTTSTTLVSGWTISAVSVPCANFCAV
jgi:type I restriction-modification system DNA methylase subunit